MDYSISILCKSCLLAETTPILKKEKKGYPQCRGKGPLGSPLSATAAEAHLCGAWATKDAAENPMDAGVLRAPPAWCSDVLL